MRRTVSRTIEAMSTYPAVVTSPAMWTWPVVIIVSTATRLRGSCSSMASRIESLIWSAILSGWPSVTDSDVKRRRDTRSSLHSVAGAAPAAGGGWPRRPRLPGPPGNRPARPPERRSRSGQPGADDVPDAGRHAVLGTGRQRGRGAVGGEHGDLVVGPAEHLPGRHVVDHQEVGALAGQLGPRVGQHVALRVAGLGGEADHQLTGGARGDQLDEDVRVAR